MTDKEKKNKVLSQQQHQTVEFKPRLKYEENQSIKNTINKDEKEKIDLKFFSYLNEDNFKIKYNIENKSEIRNINNIINFEKFKDESQMIKNGFSSKSQKEIEMREKYHKREFGLINHFINKNLSKYNSTKDDYENILIENIIMNRNIHIVSVLKDFMIYDYKDEFLKRYYSTQESYTRLPIFANYYQNYLKFFCIPLFRELNFNKITQNHGDNKAELYYVKNYGRRDLTKQNVNNMNINCDLNLNEKNENLNMRSILTTTIRENIEETIITKNDGDENSDIFSSMMDLKINENGLGIFIKKLKPKCTSNQILDKQAKIDFIQLPSFFETKEINGIF